MNEGSLYGTYFDNKITLGNKTVSDELPNLSQFQEGFFCRGFLANFRFYQTGLDILILQTTLEEPSLHKLIQNSLQILV